MFKSSSLLFSQHKQHLLTRVKQSACSLTNSTRNINSNVIGVDNRLLMMEGKNQHGFLSNKQAFLSSVQSEIRRNYSTTSRKFNQKQNFDQKHSSSHTEKKQLLSPTVRRVGYVWIAFSTFTILLIGYSVKDIIFLDEELSDVDEGESSNIPHTQPFYQYHFTMPHQIESVIKIIRSFVALGIVVVDYKMNFNTMNNVEGVTEDQVMEHKSEVHKRSAQRLVQLCLANGGVFIKAGQHIASLNQVLPPEFTDGFKPCQDKAPTRPWSIIESFIREQLTGVKTLEKGAIDPLYEEYFSKIESKPIAAGSLAQVHVAYLKGSSKKVALKVQYPDLEGSLSADSKLLKRLIAAAEFAFKDTKLQWICNEFEMNLPFELNFLNEAKNCYLLGKKLETVPRLKDHVRTPFVYWTHCTDKVLTIEFVEGFKVTDIHSMKEKGLDIDVGYISYLLSHAFSEQIFSKGFVHADPHPGNIIVSRKKDSWNNAIQLVIIDHGLYHQLDNDFKILYCRLWKAIVDYNEEELNTVSKKLGLADRKGDGPLFSELLKVILTARAHDADENLYTVHQQEEDQRKQSKNKLLAYSQKHFMDIAKVLGDLDRKVLLLLKCNDLLRSIQMDLGVPVNYFIIFAQYAIKAIHKDKLTRVFEENKSRGLAFAYLQYLQTYFSCTKEYLLFDAKLKLFMLATSLNGYYQNFKRELHELKLIVDASSNKNTSSNYTFYRVTDPSAVQLASSPSSINPATSLTRAFYNDMASL